MTLLDSTLNTANRRFSFQGGGLAADTFAVVEMSGFEALSEPFNFEVILVSDNNAVNFDAMLSNQATLKIFASGGTEGTPYHGVLSEFEQLQQVGQLVFYKAVLVPRLRRLGLYRTSDVFLDDQKIPDVLDKVIKASGLISTDYEQKILIKTDYRDRTFVCQYQETNFDFISRWMEKEGMYYYFDHSGSNDKLIIVDDRTKLPADVSNVTYRPVEDSTSVNASDSVHGFVCRQQPLPKQVILQGFNYAAASVPLEQSYLVSATGTGDVMLYGENFLTPEEGLRYARLRAQQILCNSKVFKGDATATGIRSGHFIQMSKHYREDFNVQYLVTEIKHSGSQAGMLLAGIAHSFGGKSGETTYRHSFRAIPSDAQFRPECKTKRPHIAGTISAVIDAEGSGQYADMDEFGQYKVQLPFVKSGKAANKGSARIRMATPYAGSNHGMYFPLHKDAEVLLSFVDGDPDQPVILSAVPNSENKSLVNNTNPAQSRILTKGGNALVMDDTKDVEYVKLTSPYNNTKLVVGYGGPPKSFDPFAAIWLGTSGSSESVTVGVSNAVKLGFNNSLNLSFDNSFSASMANKMSIGASTSFGVGHDISWTKGKSIKIDDADSVVLKESGKLLANDKITIGGGQLKPITAAITSTKATVQTALKISMAVNGAIALAAGVELTKAQKDGDKGKVDVKDTSNDHWAARGLGIGGGLSSAALVHTLLYTMGKAVALTDDEATYRGKIVADAGGVDISATNALLTSIAQVKATSGGVKVSAISPTVLLGSDLEVNPSSIGITARNTVGLETKLTLSGLAAKLETGAGGKIALEHALGGSVRVTDSKIVAESFTTKLELAAAGATVLAGPESSLKVTPAKVSADCMLAHMKLTPSSASLSLDSGAGFFVSPAGPSISGVLIRLG